VSGLLPAAGGQLVAIGGEGGHVTLAAADAQEAAVLQVLQRRFGHASAERALSGPGLENLYLALAEAAGQPLPPRPAAEITREALAGTSRPCMQALEMFCSLLGSVAGNLALTLGARGGVFIGGGIVPRLGDWLDRSRFRERFESKGRFRAYLQAIPTFVVQAGDEAALLGAARALYAG
jgi:glucokinase